MPIPVLRSMTAVIAPRGRWIHITGLNSPGLTACRKKCNGWRVAPIAGARTDAEVRAAVTCDQCEEAMVRAVKAAAAARRSARAR